jgi:hypothetical protein
MNQEAPMTVRIGARLHQQFNEIAEAQRRPAAQILQELMESYVEHVRGKTDSERRIDPREVERRRADFDAALASITLEGFGVPEDYRAEAGRFIRGEIEFDALTAKMHELALGH